MVSIYEKYVTLMSRREQTRVRTTIYRGVFYE